MRFIIPTILILTISCNSKSEKKPLLANEINITPTEINVFYVDLNIIVDHSNRIYYHIHKPKHFGRICGYGINPEYPEYIHLRPNTLIETNIEKLHALALKYRNTNKACVCIGIHKSKKDIFKKLKAEFRGIEGMVIRKRDLTEEEQVVLAYKATKSKYNPRNVKWLNPNLMRHLGFEPIIGKSAYPEINQSAH